MSAIVIIGGGTWGCAIASSLQRAQQPFTVLARSQHTVDNLIRGKCPKLIDCAPIASVAATTNQKVTVKRQGSQIEEEDEDCEVCGS